MPNITGNFTASERTDAIYVPHGTDGVFNLTKTQTWGLGASGGVAQDQRINFDASRSNTTYGSSTTVTPLSLSTKFFIKY